MAEVPLDERDRLTVSESDRDARRDTAEQEKDDRTDQLNVKNILPMRVTFTRWTERERV